MLAKSFDAQAGRGFFACHDRVRVLNAGEDIAVLRRGLGVNRPLPGVDEVFSSNCLPVGPLAVFP